MNGISTTINRTMEIKNTVRACFSQNEIGIWTTANDNTEASAMDITCRERKYVGVYRENLGLSGKATDAE